MRNLVLLGGGYGNMRIIHRFLPNQLPDDVMITLIDRNPYHCLKTEYYALAAGTISDHHIRVSFPDHPKLKIEYGTISSVDLEGKKVLFHDREPISYDDAVIGLGCEDKYHNVPGAPEHTYSIQTIDQSRSTYQALNNLNAEATVAIVGAGLSGVELASELRESRKDLNIILFDRGELILSSFPKRLSKYVQSWFEEHGVKIINCANITKVEEGIVYNHDDPIQADAIVWTAGIQPNQVVRDLDVEKDPQGRVVLTPHHNLPGDEHVYVVGDCASLPHAPSAQLAEAQAEQIVQVLELRWKGEPLPETMPKFKLKGVLGSLGKKAGFGLVAERPLIGRVPRLLKSGLLWMYKHHNG
ncbi:NAD(P)/FAD-dependent oxidoreductase [Bacillus haynesii]|uniref:NAD(P)/FAD-dependent oxidoreductase n=1 Tax=Bacillus haynesii TaxID=1925021 RepID=UPI002281AFBA|nr:NAD(P)/FAD-dependent oxidoreductase [Bacillus haynesii]MCY8436990.1 NAD(P)/FAD-dependent oxidoreductase [Bacillus haynesii]MCY9155953.1 NAD(P)/FAD-dependent oxidoreductase [Bacillus haynesii]